MYLQFLGRCTLRESRPVLQELLYARRNWRLVRGERVVTFFWAVLYSAHGSRYAVPRKSLLLVDRVRISVWGKTILPRQWGQCYHNELYPQMKLDINSPKRVPTLFLFVKKSTVNPHLRRPTITDTMIIQKAAKSQKIITWLKQIPTVTDFR